MVKLTIVLYNVDEWLVEIVVNLLRRIPKLYVSIKQLNGVPKNLFNDIRGQYRGDLLNRWIYRNFRDSDVRVALLNVDAYVPPLNFVFGVATPKLMTCSVYLPRLRMGASNQLYSKRVLKEVIHELGHLYGLGHCANPECVMSFSNSIVEVDKKTSKLCRTHFQELRKAGINIPEDFRLV